MKLTIGSDHAGFDEKEELRRILVNLGHEVIDQGPQSKDSCDYPDFAAKVAKAVCNGDSDLGILICGTGIGMSIAANKFKGIRAALCNSIETAQMSRRHNNANILCMGSRVLSPEQIQETASAWLSTSFEGERHALRLDKIHKFEEEWNRV